MTTQNWAVIGTTSHVTASALRGRDNKPAEHRRCASTYVTRSSSSSSAVTTSAGRRGGETRLGLELRESTRAVVCRYRGAAEGALAETSHHTEAPMAIASASSNLTAQEKTTHSVREEGGSIVIGQPPRLRTQAIHSQNNDVKTNGRRFSQRCENCNHGQWERVKNGREKERHATRRHRALPHSEFLPAMGPPQSRRN